MRKRFLFSVAANLLRALLSFVTGMLLARWMGPNAFGDMAFLLGTFLGVRQLLDLGTSTAFFTFLSQRPRSRRFVNAYFVWLVIQFVVPFVIIGLLFPSAWIATVWHGEHRGLVLLAFGAAFMQNSAWPAVQQAGESQRQTLWVQTIAVAIVAAHLLAVTFLWFFGLLGLPVIFAAIAFEYLLAGIVTHARFAHASPNEVGEDDQPLPQLFRKYWTYCLPLIPYSILGFAQEFADRWLLQNYGGGVQQAFYAVGSQFAAIALLATTSILRIFWKEVAEAHHNQDHVRAGQLYHRVTRLLFLVGAVCAGYLIPWAADILRLVLGAAYVGGATTLTVMFLYPVHQSMGQIGGTMLYATERVSIVVVIGILTMIVGLVVAYLVLAPPTASVPGLGLASEGLAIKMVLVQFFGVNLTAYMIARVSKWSFDWVFQPVSLLGCLGLGWIAHTAVISLVNLRWPVPAVMALGGILYLMLTAGFVVAMPSLAGLERETLVADARRLRLALGRRRYGPV